MLQMQKGLQRVCMWVGGCVCELNDLQTPKAQYVSAIPIPVHPATDYLPFGGLKPSWFAEGRKARVKELLRVIY